MQSERPVRRDGLVARREELAMTQDRLAAEVEVTVSTVARWERGEATPRSWYRRPLADALQVTPEQLSDLLAGGPWPPVPMDNEPPWTVVRPPDPGDLAALELIRRAEASDVGAATLDGLEHTVHQLCRSYPSTPPAELAESLASYRRYVAQLLDLHATLSQRRQLMVLAGWLSLLTAVVDVDLDRRQAAATNLRAARTLGAEAGHPVLLAWAHEIEAWQAVTDGQYRQAIDSCRAGRALADDRSSALVQLAVQEVRAHARLGEARQTHELLDEAATTLGRMNAPEHPEHHFEFDPRKLVAYTATTLAWLGDDDAAAEEYARRAVDQYERRNGDGRFTRRLASARVDLALVLARIGEPAEASHLGALALDSGRFVPSNLWRVAELDRSLTGRYAGLNEVSDFHERYVDVRRTVLDDHRAIGP